MNSGVVVLRGRSLILMHLQTVVPLLNCYRKHERGKKCAYKQRLLDVEHTPLVFSATGEMARQATTFYKRLASMLSVKWDQPHSSTLCWIHSRLSNSLLRSAIQSIGGARSSTSHAIKSTSPIDLVNAVAQLRPS